MTDMTTGTEARKIIQDDHHYPPVVFDVCLDPRTQDMNIWTGGMITDIELKERQREKVREMERK